MEVWCEICEIYVPDAPPAERYGGRKIFSLFYTAAQLLTMILGRLRVVVTVVGFLCGSAILLLPCAVAANSYDQFGAV